LRGIEVRSHYPAIASLDSELVAILGAVTDNVQKKALKA